MFTPVNPSFTILKWGLRGSKLYSHVFVMENVSSKHMRTGKGQITLCIAQSGCNTRCPLIVSLILKSTFIYIAKHKPLLDRAAS